MYSEKGIYHDAPYFNRELSQLEFHKRVLKQAEDESIPLLERLRFLCISSTNLDEFFEVRVAGLMQKLEAGVMQTDDDQMSASEVLRQVNISAHDLVDNQ